MVEHHNGIVGVRSSNLLGSTTSARKQGQRQRSKIPQAFGPSPGLSVIPPQPFGPPDCFWFSQCSIHPGFPVLRGCRPRQFQPLRSARGIRVFRAIPFPQALRGSDLQRSSALSHPGPDPRVPPPAPPNSGSRLVGILDRRPGVLFRSSGSWRTPGPGSPRPESVALPFSPRRDQVRWARSTLEPWPTPEASTVSPRLDSVPVFPIGQELLPRPG